MPILILISGVIMKDLTPLPLLEIVTLGFQELQDVQRFQGSQTGDIDLFQFVADLVPDLQFHVLGKEAGFDSQQFLDPAGDAFLDQAVQLLFLQVEQNFLCPFNHRFMDQPRKPGKRADYFFQ